MNKQEAADFLGVSVRALERYVQQRRISVKYEKGKTRLTANFDSSELEAFKEELNQLIVKPAFESRQITTEQQLLTNKLVHESGEVTEFGEIGVHLEFCTVCTVNCTSLLFHQKPSVKPLQYHRLDDICLPRHG